MKTEQAIDVAHWTEETASFTFGPMHADKSDSEQDALASYVAGVEEGMRRYAWWKDGAQWVGTCGTSLYSAIRKMDKEYGVVCLHPNVRIEDGVDYCARCGSAVTSWPKS